MFLAFKFVPIKYISTHSSPQYVKFIPPSLDMFFWQGLFSEHSAVSVTCATTLFWKGTATATVSRVIYLATVIKMIKTKRFFQAAFRFHCSCCFVHKCDWIKKNNKKDKLNDQQSKVFASAQTFPLFIAFIHKQNPSSGTHCYHKNNNNSEKYIDTKLWTTTMWVTSDKLLLTEDVYWL